MTLYVDVRKNAEVARLVRAAFPDFTGHQVQMKHGVQKLSLRSYWDHGARSYFVVMRLDTLQGKQAPTSHPFFDPPLEGVDAYAIPEGGVVVEKHYGLGGTTVTIHCPGTTELLPPPGPELTEIEALVLAATVRFKPSYAGVKDYRASEIRKRRPDIKPDQIEAARASLQEKGLLSKQRAVTTEGRNALEHHALRHYFW